MLPCSQGFNERVMFEAAQWLDRIEEAYKTELRYDRIEAIQKLLPQWKNTVETVRKSLESRPDQQPSVLNISVLTSASPLPPLIEGPGSLALHHA